MKKFFTFLFIIAIIISGIFLYSNEELKLAFGISKVTFKEKQSENKPVLPTRPPTPKEVEESSMWYPRSVMKRTNIKVNECKKEITDNRFLLCNISYTQNYKGKVTNMNVPHVVSLKNGKEWIVRDYKEYAYARNYEAKQKQDTLEKIAYFNTRKGWVAPLYAAVTLLALLIGWIFLPKMNWNQNWQHNQPDVDVSHMVSSGRMEDRIAGHSLNAMAALNPAALIGFLALGLGALGFMAGMVGLPEVLKLRQLIIIPLPLDDIFYRLAGIFMCLLFMRALQLTLKIIYLSIGLAILGGIVFLGWLLVKFVFTGS